MTALFLGLLALLTPRHPLDLVDWDDVP